MAKVEIEIGDDGKVGTLPEPLQKLFDNQQKEAFQRGIGKAADDIKGLEGQIKTLKDGNLSATDRERLKSLEADKSKLEEELATKNKDFVKAQEIRDKRHADELADRDARIAATGEQVKTRDARIQELVAKDIALAAATAGARKESLAELQTLLGGRIGLDDRLQPFVKDATDPGKAHLDKDGKPVSIEGFVTAYLADHPHHKAAPSGRGGGAAGGRSFEGRPADTPKGAAFERASADPSTPNLAAAIAHLGQR